jgi:hypothetical protein
MEVLFAFLKWVAVFANIDSVGSKMDIPNLSTVIAPSILSSKSGDPMQSFAVISVVTQMLEEQDTFNRVPGECLELLDEKKGFVGYESSKDILKKCERYYRGKNNNLLKSPVTSPTAVQFAPNTLHNHRSEGSLDGRGRIGSEKKTGRDSKSLERNARERTNTLRKSKPTLPHAPFSLTGSLGTNGSFTKLPTEPLLATINLSPSIRNETTQPSMKSPFVPSTMHESPPISN